MDTINPSYVAIIGDIIDSKNIEHRQEIQTKLLNTLYRTPMIGKCNMQMYKASFPG